MPDRIFRMMKTTAASSVSRTAGFGVRGPGSVGVLLVAAVSLLSGCGSPDHQRAEKIRTVEPGAFRAERGEPGAVAPAITTATDAGTAPLTTDGGGSAGVPGAGTGVSGAGTPGVSPLVGGDRGAGAFRVVPGEPSVVTGAGVPMGGAVESPQLLDAKVGDINGRPVFVSQFLAPIEGRLRAEALELDREPWMRAAAGIIQQEMRALITDELLKAEALSKLSVDQKAGLRRFLDDVRKNLLSQNRGSQQLAEERLRREQGLSQEEFLRQREDRTLVRFTLQEEIQDRINVSWRDIVQRYARDNSRYNPNPIARFYILRVDEPEEGDAESRAAVEEANRRLAAGEAFADIASSDLNTWTLDPGGMLEVEVPGTLAELEPFADELNAHATALSVGETTEPIPFGSSIIWIHLDAVEQSSTSLYDAQLSISQEIRNERTAAELERYIDRLLGRASVSDVEDMMVRLLDIAAERYGPDPRSGSGR